MTDVIEHGGIPDKPFLFVRNRILVQMKRIDASIKFSLLNGKAAYR